VPTLAQKADILALVGDGRWWTRCDCFCAPQVQAIVANLEDVIVELRELFSAEVCIELVRQDQGERVIGLFQGAGWNDLVDELVQLGSDLSCCPGWSNDATLVANLRQPDAYEAARFEVGVWAGLYRVGLAPEREPAQSRAAKRADFRVRDGRHRVAIELKSLSDPKRSRNLHELYSCLFQAVTASWPETIGSIELQPSAEIDALIDNDTEAFRREIAARIWPAIDAHFRQGLAIGRHEINGVGVIVVGPDGEAAGPNVGPRLSIRNVDEWTIERAAARVVGRVDEACRQLAATDADLRAVIVWGGLDHFPCGPVADQVVCRIAARLNTNGPDYIGIVNGHRRGPLSGWTTDAEVRVARDGRPSPETMAWPRALTAWGLLHRGRATVRATSADEMW
jgi:hypothetical protein